MSALLTAFGVPASTCTAYGEHRPTPLRFVWHHLLPESLGGATDRTNLVEVCDGCHLAIHELLYALRVSGGDEAIWGRRGARQQRDYARRGWSLAVAAGMQNRIPNEGGVLVLAAHDERASD